MKTVFPLIVCLLGLSFMPMTSAQTETLKPDSGKLAKKETTKSKPPLTSKSLEGLKWRSVGPAVMGGRITSLAVNESDTNMWWAATASGGLLKTVNNGVSFEHQFQQEAVSSIGDVAVSQSHPDVVWVGTGEANPRNSVSWGKGVYKSVDGGKTWQYKGLDKTFQISSVRIHPTNPDIVYVGALGRLWGANEERGLYKTTDGGETWKNIHYLNDETGVIDLQMHPTNPDVLLVATYERKRDGFDGNSPVKKWGEGAGLFRTDDGGATFTKIEKGMPNCKIGRIGLEFYRKDPNTVYMILESEKMGKEPENASYMGITGEDADVGARLMTVVKGGPAAKSGLEKGDIVLRIGEKTVHSYAEMTAEIRRHLAGDTITVEISRDRKSQVMTVALTTKPKPKANASGEGANNRRGNRGGSATRNPFGVRLGGQAANLQGQQGGGEEESQYGGVYKSTDCGLSWSRINSVNPRPMYFSEIRTDPSDDNHLWLAGVSLYRSTNGGEKFTSDGAGREVHVDHHALWIDPKDGRHMILGNDGGIYVTYDRGANWDHHNHVAIGQFYHVTVGPKLNYSIYGGLQDNGSWGAPNRSRTGAGTINEDWIKIGGGDGFVCRVDPNDPDQIYYESQNGGMGRRNLRTGTRGSNRPRAPRPARQGGDQNRRGGATANRAGGGQRGGQRAAAREQYRFNWRTPFILSSHNSKIFYTAGNKVFRSLDKGNKMEAISPDITASKRGSATALAESPRDPKVLYVGTDDGAFWRTKDNGHTWDNLFVPMIADVAAVKPDVEKKEMIVAISEKSEKTTEVSASVALDRKLAAAEMKEVKTTDKPAAKTKVKTTDKPAAKKKMATTTEGRRGRRGRGRNRGGRTAAKVDVKSASKSNLASVLPDRRWVSQIVASSFATPRVYATFDAHRSNDDRPYPVMSDDFGETWQSIQGDLPDSAGSTRTIAEDITNENILYLGCEFGAWMSIDRGEHWVKFTGNLPTVPVHAFAQHKEAGELIAGTHGRSIWILDVSAIRQMSKETVTAASHLYKPGRAIIWRSEPSHGGTTRRFVGENPATGARIYYSLGKKASEVTLTIRDLSGKEITKLETKNEKGFHSAAWNLRGAPRSRTADGRAVPARFRRRFAPRVKPGTFVVELTVDGKSSSHQLIVDIDPENTDQTWLESEFEAELMEAQEGDEEEGDDDEEDDANVVY